MNEFYDSFIEARENYIAERSNQRKLIVALLEKGGYSVVTGSKAGTGVKNYKSGANKLEPPHDLRHHKWVETKVDKKSKVGFLISLNPFDVDSSSGKSASFV